MGFAKHNKMINQNRGWDEIKYRDLETALTEKKLRVMMRIQQSDKNGFSKTD